ncbi:MAG TPA: selenocysteine-specific translation elongation factor [Candidatus Saccharimonadales bacterium]|nr:selenocysteine-specific translation elongation factor [Candidatus Saccharimonadales bacterium]
MGSTSFIVATAGHVDHGKSALVKALTGTDPDRLPEEKARGITIDLGFAHLELAHVPGTAGPAAAAEASDPSLSVGLIDVPGHEDFVKNMVAGVGSIDAALFIVAADDGWMPQTEEHLQILTYLGVRHAVVALTKIDLAQGREAEACAGVRAALADTALAQAPIVATSVIDGQGLHELKSRLAEVLSALPAPRDAGKPRLPIDRVFTLHGIGTIVTGTLSGGWLRKNQTVVLQPGGSMTRIRSLQSHRRDADSAGPGTRVALNLPDLAAAGTEASGAARGHVVTSPELGPAARTLDVLLEQSARVRRGEGEGVRPVKNNMTVRVHHGSAHSLARVVLLGDEPLVPGGRVLAQLRLGSPLFVLGGDRFILRDAPQRCTLAGGLILDPDPSRRLVRTEARRAFLQPRADAPEEAQMWARTALQRDHACPRDGFLLRTRFSAAQVDEALTEMASGGALMQAGDWLLDPAWFTALREKATAAVLAEHRAHPEKAGMALSDLRRLVEAEFAAAGFFEIVTADLCRRGFAQIGTALRHEGHRPALPPKLQAAGAKLRAALAAKPLEPPSRKELTPDVLAQQALRFLLETGEAAEIGPDLVMLTEHYVRARDLIAQHLRRGPASASDLRQCLGTNRRVIIPLLERLDRDGLTRREGDQRVLRAKPG